MQYNDAINDVLFDGQFGGKPLYLDIEGPLCDRIATKLEKSTADFITGLAKAVKHSLGWDKSNIFTWHTAMAARWEHAGRGRPPPFTALLCALSVAAERMRNDDQFHSHNYYQRLYAYLSVEGERQRQKVILSFGAIPPLWIKLNRWLADKEGELGRPTAQQVSGFKNISYAVSQALIRDAERQNLHGMFGYYGFAPRETRSSSEMEVYLDRWVKTHRGTPTLARLWRSNELHERLCTAACEELQAWDGAEAANEDGLRTYSPAWVCYVDFFPPPAAIYLNLTVPVTAAAQIGQLSPADCRSLIGEPLLSGIDAAFEFEPMEDGGLASLEPSKKARAASLLQESFEFINKARTVRLRKTLSPFLLFKNTNSGGLYKEVSRLSLLEPHLVLCRQEWQPRVSKYLVEAARPGFATHNAQSLKYLPAGWVAYSGVEIVKHLQADNDLQALVPLADTSLALQRGVRLSDDAWHEQAAPEAIGASSDGPLRLELSVGEGPGRNVLGKVEADDSCVMLDLRHYEGVASAACTLTLYNGKKELRHKSIFLTSANTPRSLDVLTVPPLEYRLSGNCAGALLSAEPAGEAAPSLTGLIVNGAFGDVQATREGVSFLPDAPSFESDEEERTSTFDSEASNAGKETCAVRGHHYWIVQPHEAGQRSWEAKWLDCKDCKKHYVAKNRLQKRKAEVPPLRQKEVLEPPKIEQLDEIKPSVDTVYDALCYLGGGRYPRFSEICSQASEKSFFVARLASNLAALGHIDIQNDNVTGPPVAWRCSPPALIELSDGRAVLTGYRSRSLIASLRKAVETEGGTVETVVHDAAPTAYIVLRLSHEQLASIAAGIVDPHGRQLVLSENPAGAIARCAPAVSQLVPLLQDIYIRAGEPIERFDPATGRWNSVGSINGAGGYRTAGGSRLYAFKMNSGELRRGNYRVVKLLAANEDGRRLHGYNLDTRIFSSSLGCEPLPLFERALVACSGRLPEISHGRLLYKNVGPETAYPIIQKLYS